MKEHCQPRIESAMPAWEPPQPLIAQVKEPELVECRCLSPLGSVVTESCLKWKVEIGKIGTAHIPHCRHQMLMHVCGRVALNFIQISSPPCWVQPVSWLFLQPCSVWRVQAISPIIQNDRYNWKNPGESSWALERQHSLQPDSCGGRHYSEARMIFSEEAGSKVLLGIWLFTLPTPHAWFLSLEASWEVEESQSRLSLGNGGFTQILWGALIQILCQHLRGQCTEQELWLLSTGLTEGFLSPALAVPLAPGVHWPRCAWSRGSFSICTLPRRGSAVLHK